MWRAGLGFRVVTVDYVPSPGDPIAAALLEKARETNEAAARAAAASFGPIA